MEKNNTIAKLTMDFGIRIVKMYKYLKEEKQIYVLSKQILRSGTSIGANVYESEHAQSRPDFLSKLYISLKEANETKYWLELLHNTECIDDIEYNSINKDLRIIIGTLVNIIKKTKNNEK